MSVLKGLFRSSSRDASPSSGSSGQSSSPKKKYTPEADTKNVETIQDDQPYNPYTEIRLLARHTDIVNHLVVIDQYSLASAGSDGLVVVWGVSDGEVQQVLDGHQRLPITCLAVMEHTTREDGIEHTVLLTAASDKHIIIWDVGSGTQLHTLSTPCSTPRCILPIVIEKESTMFCSGGENLYLWSGQCELLDQIYGDRETKEDFEKLLQIKRTKVIGVIDNALYIYHIHGLSAEDTSGEGDGEITLRFCHKLSPHREAITALAQINETSFASGSMDGCIRIWSCITPSAPIRELNVLDEYEGAMKTYPLSIQHILTLQQRYLVAGVGTALHIYDSISGSLVACTSGSAHFSKITSILLAKQANMLVTCAQDGRIRLWGNSTWLHQEDDAEQPSLMEKLLGKKPEELRMERRFASLELFGECIAHAGAIQSMVECIGGSLASCSVDGLVVLWKNGEREKLQRWDRLSTFLHGSGSAPV